MKKKIFAILLFFVAYCHINESEIVGIVNDSFDSNFKSSDISDVIKFDNQALLREEKYNLDIIIRLDSEYDLGKLLNSPYYVGYGKVQDYFEVGLMLSLIISE